MQKILKNELIVSSILFGILAGVAIYLSFYIIPSSWYNENVRFLLSALSQGLAATFSLIFIISIYYLQTSKEYSSELIKRFFSAPIISYFVLFIISIILPLYILFSATFFAVWLILLSLITAIGCWALLIPYFSYIRVVIGPSLIIDRIISDCEGNIKKDRNFLIEKNLRIIMGIIVYSISNKDYPLLKSGTKSIIHLYKTSRHFPDNKKIILETLRNIRMNLVEDIIETRYIVEEISKLAEYCIESTFPRDEINKIVDLLQFTCWKAISKKDYEIVNLFAEDISNLVEYSHKISFQKEILSDLSKWLLIMGAFGHQKNDSYVKKLYKYYIKNLVSKGIIDINSVYSYATNTVMQNPTWELEKQKLTEYKEGTLDNTNTISGSGVKQ